MELVTSMVLSVLWSRKNTLDSRGKGEGRFHFFPSVKYFDCMPLCSEPGKAKPFLDRKYFKLQSLINKTFENISALNLHVLVTS
jgi:hypothetical protein